MVENNVRNMRYLCRMSTEINLGDLFHTWEPMLLCDYCKYEVAVGILLTSRAEGRYNKTCT